jgi:hypothetical protein
MSHADAQPDLGTHGPPLTWAVLLARWVDFARSAIALPDDSDGRRMRDSVADVIMLQAVWFSLKQLDELNGAERALGLDRAEVLIDKHEHALAVRWGDAMPTSIRQLIDDARRQLHRCASGDGEAP